MVRCRQASTCRIRTWIAPTNPGGLQRDHNAESSGYWKLGLSNPYVKTSGLALDTKEKVHSLRFYEKQVCCVS